MLSTKLDKLVCLRHFFISRIQWYLEEREDVLHYVGNAVQQGDLTPVVQRWSKGILKKNVDEYINSNKGSEWKEEVGLFIYSLVFCFFWKSQSIPCRHCNRLAQGRASVGLEGRYYFDIEKKFDDHGEAKDIAQDFNNNLNSTVFPGLGQLETFFGLPLVLHLSAAVMLPIYLGLWTYFTLQYGLTDRLTIGVRIPYYWRKNDVSAALDASNATVGKSLDSIYLLRSLFRGPSALPPRTHKPHRPWSGYQWGWENWRPGFGFKPIKSWSGSGVADIEVGGRYQYLKTDKWRLSFTGAVRFPTGEIDDPDNLADMGIGDGAYALLFQSQNDFVGIKHLRLNGTFRYERYLPHSMRLRVPDSVHRPLTVNEECVDRKIEINLKQR